ncbi:MAG TPA: RNA polymerase subunit sigma [Planctomycetaceae bacterium]|nr:RNA polymerase subunit sigma [Planctomycetaceae bacterium]
MLTAVYQELRSLAAARLVNESEGNTLQPTGLVHEAYLRLVLAEGSGDWDSKGHFFAAAAEAMRRILVDRARRRLARKHGGEMRRVSLEVDLVGQNDSSQTLLNLDEALDRFAAEDPQKAELVKLRYFAGMSESEAADVLEISRATASRHWSYARAWLFCAIKDLHSENEN